MVPSCPMRVDFLSDASGQIAIAIENCLAYREISELKEKLAQEKLYLEEEIRGGMDFDQIVGNSPALKQVLNWSKPSLPAIPQFYYWVRPEQEKSWSRAPFTSTAGARSAYS